MIQDCLMKVLVLGHDGRATALCRTLQKSPEVTRLWCWPGNESLKNEFRTLHHDDDFSQGIIDIFQIEVEEIEEEESYNFRDIVQSNRDELTALEEAGEEKNYRRGKTIRDENGNPVLCEDETPATLPWFEPPKEPEPDPEPSILGRSIRYPLPVCDDATLEMLLTSKPDLVIPTAPEYSDNQMVRTLRAKGLAVLGADKITSYLEHHIHEFRNLCVDYGISTYPYVFAKSPRDIQSVFNENHGKPMRILPSSPHCLHPSAVCHGAKQATDLMENIVDDMMTMEGVDKDDKVGVIVEPALSGDFIHQSFFFDGKNYKLVTTTSSYELGEENPQSPLGMPMCYISPSYKVTPLIQEQIYEILDKLTNMFERKRMYLRGLFTLTLFKNNQQLYVCNLYISLPDGLFQNVLHFMDSLFSPTSKKMPTVSRYLSDCVCYKLGSLPNFQDITPSRLLSMTLAGYADCYPLIPIKYELPDAQKFHMQSQLSIYNTPPTQIISSYIHTYIELGFHHYEPNLKEIYTEEIRPFWLTQTGEDIDTVFNTIQDFIEVLPKLNGIKYYLGMERLNQSVRRQY